MTQVTNKFYYDASHGWLAVKFKAIQELGLADKISKHSYIKGATVYLEEDVDMPLYIDAQFARGITVNAVSIDHGKRSIVRNYNIYYPNNTALAVPVENNVDNTPAVVDNVVTDVEVSKDTEVTTTDAPNDPMHLAA